MKKLIILLIVILTSCGPSYEEKIASESKAQMNVYTEVYIPYGITVITVDSCQYITYKVSTGACVIHKQNCKNHLYQSK